MLVVSHRDDPHAHAVLRKLTEVSGVEGAGVLFDTATFPAGSRVAIGHERSGALSIHPPLPEVYGSRADALMPQTPPARIPSLALDRVRAIYWRRPRPNVVDRAMTDPDLRLYAAKASRQTVEGTVEALALTCRVVDAPSRAARAGLKVLQLALARRARLRVPRTLVTNDPDAAAAFVARVHATGADVISKSPADLHYFSARTEVVDERKLEQLEACRFAPAILQARVVGGPDVRITVVGTRAFGMAQTSRPEYEADARLDPAPRREGFDVPLGLQRGIQRVQRALGLSFGAYDFKCDARGRPHFLEVNPMGQWLGTEFAVGHPIAEALARHLWEGPGAEGTTTGAGLREDQLDSLYPAAVQAEYAAMERCLPPAARA